MSHEEPEMNEIEAALAAWTPRAPQIDRDRLMFAAGRASAGSERTAPAPSPALPRGGRVRVGAIPSPIRAAARRYLWPLATSLSTAAALAMAFLLAQDRAGRDTEGGVIASPPQIAAASAAEVPPPRGGLPGRWELPAVPDGTYLALRNRMLTTPADQWPVPASLNDDVRRGATAVRPLGSGTRDAAHDPPTSRNLLREFLPPEPPARRGAGDPAESPAAYATEPHEALT